MAKGLRLSDGVEILTRATNGATRYPSRGYIDQTVEPPIFVVAGVGRAGGAWVVSAAREESEKSFRNQMSLESNSEGDPTEYRENFDVPELKIRLEQSLPKKEIVEAAQDAAAAAVIAITMSGRE